jgi:hypothetical protein
MARERSTRKVGRFKRALVTGALFLATALAALLMMPFTAPLRALLKASRVEDPTEQVVEAPRFA